MKIYHTPMLPCTDDDTVYRPTREYYEGEADTLEGYLVPLLAELNASGGTWRPMKAGEVKIYGKIEPPFCILRGEYPEEPPYLVAYFGK